MKAHRMHVAAVLLAAASALAMVAPAASADHDDRRDGRRYESRGARHERDRDDRWRDDDDDRRRDRRWAREAAERSYFYLEVATGRTHSHITYFRPDHAGRGWGPIEQIDKRTGRVLNAYVWDGDDWREWRRGDRGRYGRGGWRDRPVSYRDGYR